MRNRLFFLWMLILAIGLASVFLYQRGWLGGLENIGGTSFAPIQKTFVGILTPVGDTFSSLAHITQLQSENTQLRERVDTLTTELVRLQEISIENERLRAELDFRNAHTDFQFLSASIIGRNPTNVVRSVTIDQGTDQGVQEGMVVVSPAGLVGKISQAMSNSSKVLLIVDTTNSVNGMLQREDARASGVLYGLPYDQLSMRYLPQATEVKQNDLIITSGIGGGYPKGILIGRIISVSRNDIEMFQDASVEPSVNFEKLENVMVITNFKPRQLDEETKR